MDAYTDIDALGIFLSGGSTNRNPEDSLGGEISTREVRGMEVIYTTPVQGVVIEDVTPENGEGSASIAISGNNATYTPPDGVAGAAVTIAAGERKILQGDDETKAIRLYRPSGKTFSGTAQFELKDVMNGVFSMSNVPDADRQAGSVCYRAFFFMGRVAIDNLCLWIETDGQSIFEMALEVPDSLGVIQDISDEYTEPAGLSWEVADAESTALIVGGLDADELMGVWIKRTFPASGVVAANEQVELHIEFGDS